MRVVRGREQQQTSGEGKTVVRDGSGERRQVRKKQQQDTGVVKGKEYRTVVRGEGVQEYCEGERVLEEVSGERNKTSMIREWSEERSWSDVRGERVGEEVSGEGEKYRRS